MDERLLGAEPENISNLPRRIWVESKKIWRIAFPAMLARVTQFGMFVVTQAFIGHLGEVDLAAYALIQILTVRFVNGILLGMSSATETLCGQAFGARQHHMMGIYLQRSWLINVVIATILLPVFIYSASIFKLLGEEDETSEVAGYISLWFIPILYYFAFGFSVQKYLQTQLKNKIVGWLSAITFVLHVLLSWIFVSKLNWGIPGAMSAMIISYWLVLIGTFVYVFGGWCPNTWTGFSLAAFQDLLPVLKLSLSSGVMLCLEFWYNAVLILLAGYVQNATVAISAFSICLNIIAWEFMVFLGFLTAASVRVSNELGKGDAKAAEFSVKVISSTSVILGVFFWILCLIFGHKLAYLFTSDEEVVAYVSSLYILLSLSILLNCVQAVLSGVAVGAGRQAVVAYVNIGCYYLIGIPVGAILGYVAKLEVEGLWIGMILGVVMQSLVLGYITFKTNWNDQVNKASERLHKLFLKPTEGSSIEEPLNE
ncbi:protein DETOXIFICATION 24 [Quercus suber]|uniref:protein DETOXIFICATION 24 n=1 Tax=Quercus suber TaxID=58331 RepID=UPI000CE21410|nr:protein DETOXIFICATION 24-like [Quercus suber]